MGYMHPRFESPLRGLFSHIVVEVQRASMDKPLDTISYRTIALKDVCAEVFIAEREKVQMSEK